MSKVMDKSDIVRNFSGCIHCSQLVFGQWAEELGLSEEEARKIAGPFGGGCFVGDVCGCVAGALMALGYKFGHFELGDTEGNARMVEKVKVFEERFVEENGAFCCKDLTGYDFSKEGQFEKAVSAGITVDKCPGYVNSALSILDDLMQE